MVNIGIFILGVLVLYFGANILVKNASKFASSIGVSPLVIGVTVVGIGTSLPETVVGIVSSMKKTGEISYGNIIGANVFDLCVVIGISAIVKPLIINTKLIQRELKWMFASILLLFIFSLNTVLGSIEGVILLLLYIIYLIYCYYQATRKSHEHELKIIEEQTKSFIGITKKSVPYLVKTIAGLILLISGGDIIVIQAIKFAKIWNLNETFVGMTLVSFGTVLPEFTTSVVASVKNEPDISIGNVIGTVIYNTVFVLGIASIINKINITKSVLIFQLPILLLISVLLFPIVRIQSRISRKEGILLTTLYFVFILTLFIAKQ